MPPDAIRSGERIHSRYNGTPRLLWLLPQLGEMTIKRLEPFLALIVGWVIYNFNPPLGSFLITAAIGLGVKVGLEFRANRVRAMDINDALIEQKIAIESVRIPQRR